MTTSKWAGGGNQLATPTKITKSYGIRILQRRGLMPMCSNVFTIVLFLHLLLNVVMTDKDQSNKELVLYTQPSFLQVFSKEVRLFEVNGMTWKVKQDWNQLGVAGVIWESVSRL